MQGNVKLKNTNDNVITAVQTLYVTMVTCHNHF